MLAQSQVETTYPDLTEKRARIICFYTANSDCVGSITAFKDWLPVTKSGEV